MKRELHVRFCERLEVKVLRPTHHGTGMCLFSKRLESGRFIWPPVVDKNLHLTAAQLSLLIEGIDWRRTHVPQHSVHDVVPANYLAADARQPPVFI